MKTSKILIILLALLVFALLLLKSLLVKPTPPSISPEPIPSRFPATNQVKVKLIAPSPEIPPHLNLFKISTPEINAYATNLASQLQLVQNPSYPTLWTNPQNQHSLVLNPYNLTLILSLHSSPPRNSGIVSEQAVQSALKFLDTLSLSDISPQLNEVIYPSQIQEFINPTPNSSITPEVAKYIIIPFTQTLSGYPLISNNLNSTQLSIIVDADYQIAKVIFTTPTQQTQTLSTKQSKNLDQVIREVESGAGIITSAQSNTHIPNDSLKNLNRLTLTKASLVYRLNPQDSIASPYYNFTGQGYTPTNSYEIEIIIPAT